MFKNYLKIALRQLQKNTTFSVINIAGLAIGMAAVILLLLWIQNEVSYDQFHEKGDRIYELWNRAKWDDKLECWPVTPKIAAKTLATQFPEIEKVIREDWPSNRLLITKDKRLFAQGNAVDPAFLSTFSFPLIEGNLDEVFKTPNEMLITPKLAEKLFGNENPIGKIISLEDKSQLTITGIIDNPPNNTRFNFEYLIPWKFTELNEGEENNWNNNSTHTYVLIKDQTNITKLQGKIKNLRKDYSNSDDNYEMFLYPCAKWRLYSSFQNGVEDGQGKIQMVKLLATLAIFLLLIACINFMNLSTARSEKRAKEVGIRKTIGAQKNLLITQFLSETITLSICSFIIALLLVQLCLPAFNKLSLKELHLDYSNFYFWLYSILFILITGILAGLYPAFYLSSFNPVVVLKGSYKSSPKGFNSRKALVVFQFVFAIVLIVATIVINQQINYVISRETGYNNKNIIYHFLSADLNKNYEVLKHELISNKLAVSVTKTNAPITERWSDSWGFEWEGKDPNDRTDFDRYIVDEGIVKTAGLKLIAGRDFDLQKYVSDSNALIINESTLKVIGYKDPVGKIIKDGGQDYHIIGVIKDFVINSPYEPTTPMMMVGAKNGWFNVMHIRLNDKTAMQDLNKIEALFKKYNPEFPFNYKFADEEYAHKFDDMKKVASLASIFASLAIFISCLGLFGLATYMAENRVKEIGVRKVLGASVINITGMLSANFLKLVLISFAIATPISWYLMNQWLINYTYRINIEWWVFLLAGTMVFIIAIITVSYHSIKAAIANPVKNLRTE
jgi:ABC-type antimicrobial peptide transport system permease subunit